MPKGWNETKGERDREREKEREKEGRKRESVKERTKKGERTRERTRGRVVKKEKQMQIGTIGRQKRRTYLRTDRETETDRLK